MISLEMLEVERLTLQDELDGRKTSEERNRMGQFATPTPLAREILSHGLRLLPKDKPVKFLDPGIGTGSFYSALRATVGEREISRAVGFEIDPHYFEPARKLWKETKLDLRNHDFTTAVPDAADKANLLICNPPYVRHHHIDSDTKVAIQARTEAACGVRISGLAGLYCYFMGLAHQWLTDDGVAGWLIPSEFMDVNYGQQVKQYLLSKVTLLQIHRFDPADAQFSDALVSSAVVWFRSAPPPKGHKVLFTYGGTLAKPAVSRIVSTLELSGEQKWTRYPSADSASVRATLTLGDLFSIKRGLATGDNNFFLLSRAQIAAHGLPMECFRPVLPSARYVPTDEIFATKDGIPILEKELFLLDTRLPEDEIALRYPALKAYLDTGKVGAKAAADSYLCRSRNPWYSQEDRPAAPFVCTYMGRPKAGGRPFRFILNHSQATACNVYLMLYPKPPLARALARDPSLKHRIWQFLNDISTEELLGKGRVYGGGLHKMEPKELRNVSADTLVEVIPDLAPEETPAELFQLFVA